MNLSTYAVKMAGTEAGLYIQKKIYKEIKTKSIIYQ